MARDDPFSGIKLSEQTGASQVEQRLFSGDQKPPAPAQREAASSLTTTAKPATPIAKSVAPAADPVKTEPRLTTSPRFSLNEQPLYKASYQFTQEELNALEDLKLELRRENDSKVTKNDLIRSALHLLLDDHTANGSHSYASRKTRHR